MGKEDREFIKNWAITFVLIVTVVPPLWFVVDKLWQWYLTEAVGKPIGMIILFVSMAFILSGALAYKVIEMNREESYDPTQSTEYQDGYRAGLAERSRQYYEREQAEKKYSTSEK